MGSQLGLLKDVPLIFLILVVVLMVNFLTEITSNVATASMLLPVMASLASAMEVHPYGLMIAATVAASCAFMLPVATPPNAVVFGSGYLRIVDMVRAGFPMNLISSIILTLLVYWLLPSIWGF
jgi:sodium-dependent dicarboxylate transporter 2/3/5